MIKVKHRSFAIPATPMEENTVSERRLHILSSAPCVWQRRQKAIYMYVCMYVCMYVNDGHDIRFF